MEKIWSWRKGALLMLGLGFGLLGYRVREVFAVIFASLALAYLLEPLVKFIEAHRFSRAAAIGVVYVLLAAVAGGIVFAALPQLSGQIGELQEVIPKYWQEMQIFWAKWQEGSARFHLPEEIRYLVRQSAEQAEALLSGLIGQMMAGIVAFCSHLLDLFLVPVMSFYLLRDKDFLLEQGRKLLPMAWQGRLEMMWREIDHLLKNYLLGSLTVSFIVAGIVTVGLKIIGMDFALLCGLLVGALNIVPYFGAILGAIPAIFLGLRHSLRQAAAVVVVMVIAQQLESNIITPRLLGEKIGVHPLAVLLGVLVWGKLLGIWGILLAVPATGIIKILLYYLLDWLIPLQAR